MNYTQSFEEFSGSLGPTDLALYAGVGIVLFILFKDRLSPVQKMVLDFLNQFKSSPKPVEVKPVVNSVSVTTNSPLNSVLESINMPSPITLVKEDDDDKFLDLILSWKQTRDLAVESGCDKAVEMLDEVFQYLSPTKCDLVEKNNE